MPVKMERIGWWSLLVAIAGVAMALFSLTWHWQDAQAGDITTLRSQVVVLQQQRAADDAATTANQKAILDKLDAARDLNDVQHQAILDKLQRMDGSLQRHMEGK